MPLVGKFVHREWSWVRAQETKMAQIELPVCHLLHPVVAQIEGKSNVGNDGIYQRPVMTNVCRS